MFKSLGRLGSQGFSFVCCDTVTRPFDYAKPQERLLAWEMVRNKLTHVMLLVQHSYTVCVFYRRAMPSSSPHFRCFMFIAMPVGQNISLEIVVFSGTVIGFIDSSQLQGKVAQSHLAHQTSFIFVRQGISSRRVAWC